MTITAQFDPDTETLSDTSSPWMTLADLFDNTGVQKAGCSVVLLPAGMPTPPDNAEHVAHAWCDISGHNCQIRMTRPLVQTDILTTGRWVRFCFLLPKATRDAVAKAGQIKLMLSRSDTGNDFVTLGVGPEFNSNDASFASRGTNSDFHIATTPPITPDIWHEAIVYEKREPGMGHAAVWYDGVLQGSASFAAMGDDNPTSIRDVAVGLVWTQLVGSRVEVYTSGITVANAALESLITGLLTTPPVPGAPPVQPPITPPVTPPSHHAEQQAMLVKWLRAGAGSIQNTTVTDQATVTFADGAVWRCISP